MSKTYTYPGAPAQNVTSGGNNTGYAQAPNYYHDQNQYMVYNQAPGQPAQGQYPQQYNQQQVPADGSHLYNLGSWFDYRNPNYLKGLLLGAGVALVVSNPTVQRSVVNGAVRMWAAVQGGVEEIKEQVRDAQAELSQED